MARTPPRSDPVLLALTAILIVGLTGIVPNAAAHAAPVEGESGTPVNPSCSSDGEVMRPTTSAMFFPAAGCAATYAYDGYNAITSLRFEMTGVAGTTYCGHFTITGALEGVAGACALHGTWVTVSVSSPGRNGGSTFTVTWWTNSPGTPSWVNSYLDQMIADPAPPSAPQNLRNAPGTGVGHILLTWDAPAQTGGLPITSYNIYRSGAVVDSIPAATRTYSDNCGILVTCTYEVSAVNEEGEGARSPAVTARWPL